NLDPDAPAATAQLPEILARIWRSTGNYQLRGPSLIERIQGGRPPRRTEEGSPRLPAPAPRFHDARRFPGPGDKGPRVQGFAGYGSEPLRMGLGHVRQPKAIPRTRNFRWTISYGSPLYPGQSTR